MRYEGPGDDDDRGVDLRMRRLSIHDLPPARAAALRNRCHRALGPHRGGRARGDSTFGLALPAAAVLSFVLLARVVHDTLAILGVF